MVYNIKKFNQMVGGFQKIDRNVKPKIDVPLIRQKLAEHEPHIKQQGTATTGYLWNLCVVEVIGTDGFHWE